MKTLLTAAAVLGLMGMAAGSVRAASITGGFGFATHNSGNDTASSIQLNATNFSQGATGSFSSDPLAAITASTGTLTGLSPTATAVDVPDYLVFTTDAGSGNDDFHFELTSIKEFYFGGGVATFTGSGTLTDGNGVLDPTPANVIISFSSDTNYAGTVAAVAATPEPASLSLLGFGAVGLLSRRRKNAHPAA